MDPVSVVLAALVALGLVAVVGGALHDRSRRRRRAAALAGPPDRVIPRLPVGAAPRYLSEADARRPPADAPSTALAEDERRRLREAVGGPGWSTVTAGWAGPAFVTDEGAGWAVLEEPTVLVCADVVGSLRELLPLLERAARTGGALVVVAPEVAREVRSTLEVNRLQRRLDVLLVLADDDAAAAVAQACGATPVTAGDRRAGWLPPSTLGRCERWVAEADVSHLLPGRDPAA